MPRQCQNPECKNGVTPGVVIAGKGNAKVPVLGATQKWGWVRCLACNAPDDALKAGARYRPLRLSEDEIARRASLATQRAPYAPMGDSLGKLRTAGAARPASPQGHTGPSAEEIAARTKAAAEQTAQMNKLLEQISQLNNTVMKLTNQVTDLLEENRTLRKQMEARSNPSRLAATASEQPIDSGKQL